MLAGSNAPHKLAPDFTPTELLKYQNLTIELKSKEMSTRKTSHRNLLLALGFTIVFLPLSPCWGFGRGGGGGGGARGGVGGGGGARGGGGGGGGGGFSGGASRGGGSSNNISGGQMAAGRPNPGGSFNAGQAGARPAGGSERPNFGGGGASNFNSGGAGPRAGLSGAPDAAANRYNAPSKNDLSGFLGLPSDEGMSHVGAKAGTMANGNPFQAGSNLDVNKGTAEGPRGGQAAGVAVTGPEGNTVGKAAAVGPNGGAAAVGGVQGAAGGAAARGVAVGPGGQVVAGRGAVGPGGYGAGGIATAGPAGVGAGFTRVTPSGRYTAAAAVRGNFNNWGVYNQGWYAQYPGAWFAAGVTANAIWNASTWTTASSYCGYSEQPPVYYDYGNNVVYQDNSVYINGDSAGTSEEFYDSASNLASTGAQAEASSDGDWLPLGVFAFTKADQSKSDITIQLAVNKDGVLRGNYTDTASKQNQVIQGSVDKETQRVAFTVGDNTTNILETGLYNLTKAEAPCLVHLGKEKTEQWLLVRLENPDSASN